MEVSELVSALKSRLNIADVPLAAAPAAAAPAGGAAPAAVAAEEEKPKEKTIFTVKLEKFDAAAKAKVIREVKAMMPNMNLVEVGLVSFFFSPKYSGPGQTHPWWKIEIGGIAAWSRMVLGTTDFARCLGADLQAKKFVESVPQVLKENLPKDEAEKLQKTLTDLGATVSLS